MARWGPRFPQTVELLRPTIDPKGDVVVPASGTLVSGAVWMRRRKPVQAGVGEVREVVAMGFLPSGTDVARRDRLHLGSGQVGGPHQFVVLEVVPAFDDRGRLNHVGLELTDAPEATDR